MAKRTSSVQLSPAKKAKKTVDSPEQSKIAVLGALHVRPSKVVAHPAPTNFGSSWTLTQQPQLPRWTHPSAEILLLIPSRNRYLRAKRREIVRPRGIHRREELEHTRYPHVFDSNGNIRSSSLRANEDPASLATHKESHSWSFPGAPSFSLVEPTLSALSPHN
ncbi:uncharacterized protein N7529_006051 [Penicillium soppii]|uniref:uncharacterized protein n=1 Tax=Penicillium soppii TaxID=69789 RepID=UPI002546E07B|nr:uncharacterized protein N7529_006051 [Penicillium soppii]KAJ5864135.1 hypothetical protein N7529_006051 [Penicillium soppii]